MKTYIITFEQYDGTRSVQFSHDKKRAIKEYNAIKKDSLGDEFFKEYRTLFVKNEEKPNNNGFGLHGYCEAYLDEEDKENYMKVSIDEGECID